MTQQLRDQYSYYMNLFSDSNQKALPSTQVQKQEVDDSTVIDLFGTRTGLACTFGGVIAFLNIPLNKLVLDQMNGDFLFINMSFLACYLLCYCFIEYTFGIYQTPMELHLIQLQQQAQQQAQQQQKQHEQQQQQQL